MGHRSTWRRPWRIPMCSWVGTTYLPEIWWWSAVPDLSSPVSWPGSPDLAMMHLCGSSHPSSGSFAVVRSQPGGVKQGDLCVSSHGCFSFTFAQVIMVTPSRCDSSPSGSTKKLDNCEHQCTRSAVEPLTSSKYAGSRYMHLAAGYSTALKRLTGFLWWVAFCSK